MKCKRRSMHGKRRRRSPIKQELHTSVAESTGVQSAKKVEILKEEDVKIGDTSFSSDYLRNIPRGKGSGGEIKYNITDVRRKGFGSKNALVNMIKNIATTNVVN